jgi:hypothetical protein
MLRNVAKYEKEIDRLDRMAEKLDSLGMAKNHKATVKDLRLRLERLKKATEGLS